MQLLSILSSLTYELVLSHRKSGQQRFCTNNVSYEQVFRMKEVDLIVKDADARVYLCSSHRPKIEPLSVLQTIIDGLVPFYEFEGSSLF